MENKIINGTDYRIIIFIGIIGIVSFSLRMYFFPFEVPLVMDSLLYFWYANDMSILGTFPSNYDFPNNFWPAIVSVFFSVSDSNNYLDYMNIQRAVAVTFSILTIIPMYYLSRRFFGKSISILATAFIAFAPRLILNSFLGITESLFVFLITTVLWLFLSTNKKSIFISFAIAALFSLVRYEGVLIIIPMTIIYFVRFRKDLKFLKKYVFALLIFVLVLLPMSVVNMDTMGYDGIFSHVNAGITVTTEQNFLNEDPDKRKFFPDLAIFSIIENLVWLTVPMFIIFMPLGVFYLFKNREYKKNSLIFFIIILAIPELYAFGRGMQDYRYMLDLLPIFTIISLLAIDNITKKIKKRNMVLVIIVIALILMSIIVITYKENFEHQREAYRIATDTKDVFDVINDHHPEQAYRRVVVIDQYNEFPLLREEVNKHTSILPYGNSNSIEEFIKENRYKGLKHLVIDDNPTRPDFIKNILKDEEKFSYLEKIFDSKENDYKYDFRIFQIDFKEFDRINP